MIVYYYYCFVALEFDMGASAASLVAIAAVVVCTERIGRRALSTLPWPLSIESRAESSSTATGRPLLIERGYPARIKMAGTVLEGRYDR